jgi:hypothetical protein
MSLPCECRAAPVPHPNDWTIRAYRWVFWLLLIGGCVGGSVVIVWRGITQDAPIAVPLLAITLGIMVASAIMQDLLAAHSRNAETALASRS